MQVTAEPGPVYSLATYVTTNRARGIAGGIGALLCLGGAAAAVWTLSMLQLVRVPDVVNGLISWMNIMWATLLGVGALLGCLMLVAAVRAWGTMTIRADALGLRMAGPESSVLLRWNAVAGITYISARNRTMYVVQGRDGASVAWPAKVTPVVRAQAEPGAVAVTPDELAAVVAERSGKPVEARRWW